MRGLRGQAVSPWLLALPALAVYAVFLCWPAVRSLWLSFTSWDGLSTEQPFVGLDNYVRIVEDRTARLALVNNLLWAIVTIVVPVVLGLALAVALHGSARAKPFLRTVFYMPAVLPLVAVATIWGWLFQPSGGAVNETLEMLGLGALAQPWLGQDSTALWAAMIPAIWVRTGFPMLLYLAALQTIPRELYESASTDGATAWQQFRHVTFPNLRGAHYIVVALSVIESFKVFDLVYAMTYGGPGRSTQVLGTWMYFNVFQYYEAGYGAAIAVVITLIALAVGIPYVRSQTREQS
jgi:raffinose/stachyose/melibiose transport system permease protein